MSIAGSHYSIVIWLELILRTCCFISFHQFFAFLILQEVLYSIAVGRTLIPIVLAAFVRPL